MQHPLPAHATVYAMQQQAHNGAVNPLDSYAVAPTKQGKMIRLLIVEDHQSVVDALVHRLDQCSSVTIAHNMADFQQALREQRFDLAIVDLVFSYQLLGLQMMPILRDAKIPFIVYSGNAEPWHIRKALSYGASGYVSKSGSLSHITTAFDAVVNGGVSFPDELSKALFAPCNLQGHKPLTKREIKVLDMMFLLAVPGSDKAPSNQDIADALHLSCRTIGNTFTDIFANFNFSQRRDAFFEKLKEWGYFPGVLSKARKPKK